MLAVHRDQPATAAPGRIGDEPSACHQRLLVGQGGAGLPASRAARVGAQAHHAAEGVEDQLGLRHRSYLTEPLLPFQHGDTGIGELLPQLGAAQPFYRT